MDLERLFYYFASNIGSPFTYASIAKIFEITDKTIKEYIKALVDANLLFEVDKFSFSLKQQMRAPKKLYAIDTGMINAVAFKVSGNHSKLFENIVYLELKRKKQNIFYYRTASDYEVDFIVQDKGCFELIQVIQICLGSGKMRASSFACKPSIPFLNCLDHRDSVPKNRESEDNGKK